MLDYYNVLPLSYPNGNKDASSTVSDVKIKVIIEIDFFLLNSKKSTSINIYVILYTKHIY